MTTWNSRILVRSDNQGRWEDSVPKPTLSVGEVGMSSIGGGSVEVRIGASNEQAFSDAPVIVPNGTPDDLTLIVDESSAGGTGVSDGSLVVWESDAWEATGTPIQFAPNSPSGVLTYTASTDTWATDTASFVPSSLDGGDFSVNVVAPSFSASYQPSIGDAG